MAQKIRRVPGTVLGVRTIREVRRYKVWDCSSCGRKGFNAKKCHQCVGCGNPKDASDNEQRSVTEVDANYEHTGADVTCLHCGAENVARFSCKQCGAALDTKFEDIVKQFPSTTDQSWRAVHVQADDQGFVPGATETPWNDGSAPVVLEEPGLDIEPPPLPPTPAAQNGWNLEDAVIEAEERARRDSQERDNRLQSYSVIFAVLLGLIGIVGMFLYN
jgi:ribosomal protein L37E